MHAQALTHFHACILVPDMAFFAGEYWTSADIVDCILSYTVTQLMDIMTDANSREGAQMLARVSVQYAPAHAHNVTAPLHMFVCTIYTPVSCTRQWEMCCIMRHF